MATVKITIDESLPFSELKRILSLVSGDKKIELADFSTENEQEEYEK